jgi:hypothetical protein
LVFAPGARANSGRSRLRNSGRGGLMPQRIGRRR